MTTYINRDREVAVEGDKFIYKSSVYVLWERGAALWDEKYYTSNNPITFKKKDLLLKRKKYKLYRYWDLIQAPEFYLINNGYERNS